MNLLRKLRALLFRKKFERDMADEMRMHLEMKAQSLAEDGASPEEARFAARRAFGGEEQVKEIAREQRSSLWLEELTRNLRYTVQQSARAKGFTLVVVLTLAVAIGASAI